MRTGDEPADGVLAVGCRRAWFVFVIAENACRAVLQSEADALAEALLEQRDSVDCAVLLVECSSPVAPPSR